MSELEKVRERIGYLKFWLGVCVASDIGLSSWLFNNQDTLDVYKGLILGLLIIVFSFGAFRIHKGIDQKINQLEDL